MLKAAEEGGYGVPGIVSVSDTLQFSDKIFNEPPIFPVSGSFGLVAKF